MNSTMGADVDARPSGASTAASARPGPALLPVPGSVVRFDPVASADDVLRHVRHVPIASPAARMLATAHGIALDTVSGSGRRARIRVDDVRAQIDARDNARPTAATTSASPESAHSAPPAPTPAAIPPGYATVPHTVVALSPRRRAIAEHMLRSRATSAHASVETDIDLGPLSTIRNELNAGRRAQQHKAMSFLPLIARATVVALRHYPNLNATVVGNDLLQWNAVNFGIAVNTPVGLLVPVVRDAHELTAGSIADRIGEASLRARERRITADELVGGTFTISNVGSVGPVLGSPVINQPQVAILVTGAVMRRPWVLTQADGTESIGIRPIMRANLTFDHRVIDGAEAGRCLDLLREHLETWPIGAYR